MANVYNGRVLNNTQSQPCHNLDVPGKPRSVSNEYCITRPILVKCSPNTAEALFVQRKVRYITPAFRTASRRFTTAEKPGVLHPLGLYYAFIRKWRRSFTTSDHPNIETLPSVYILSLLLKSIIESDLRPERVAVSFHEPRLTTVLHLTSSGEPLGSTWEGFRLPCQKSRSRKLKSKPPGKRDSLLSQEAALKVFILPKGCLELVRSSAKMIMTCPAKHRSSNTRCSFQIRGALLLTVSKF